MGKKEKRALDGSSRGGKDKDVDQVWARWRDLDAEDAIVGSPEGIQSFSIRK
jgi:hypothetical protein